MNLLRRLPFLCFCMALVAITGFCLSQSNLELLVVAGVLAALSWYVTEGPRGRTLPRWVSNLLVLAAAGSVILDVQSNGSDLPGVLGRFTVWLILIKLYERRTARDHGQIMLLTLLLMLIGSAEMPPPLLFGVILTIYAGLGLYCVLLYHLYAAHEQITRTRREAGLLGVSSTRPTIGRQTGRQLRRLTVGVGFAVVACSVAFFLLFPRHIGRGMFSLRGVEGIAETGSLTGFGEEIDLDTGNRISESPRLLFTVEVLGPGGRMITGSTLRFRGTVLDRYEDGRWTASSPGAREIRTAIGRAVALPPREPGPQSPVSPTVTQRFEFVRDTDRLFHLGAPWRVRIDSAPRTIRFRPAVRTMRLTGREARRVRGYEMTSVLLPAPEDIRRLVGGVEDSTGITGDLGDPRHPVTMQVRAIARQILADAGIDERPTVSSQRDVVRWRRAAVRAIREHLLSGEYGYTLDLSDVPASRSVDPIVRFLVETKRGHCEYYASAVAALCQSIGIEARVIAGFAASEWDPATGRYVVRARHAHAWNEVRLDRWQWETVDATPAAVTQPSTASDPGFAGRMSELYERWEGVWADRFVGFDPGLQTGIFDAIDRGRSATVSTWFERLKEWASNVNRAFRFGAAGYVWLGIVGFAALIAVVAFVRWVTRRVRIRRGLAADGASALETERMVRRLAFYFDMLDDLSRYGVAKPRWQPPVDFASSVAGRLPAAAPIVTELSHLYYRGRYGGVLPDVDEERAARGRLEELRLLLRARS